MPKSAAISINLLPKDPFLETPVGKLLQRAPIGRYLVIFTELVVIMSFASRFTLDRRITDLNGAILQKQTIIQSYGDLEENVRAIQKKISSYQQVEQQENIVDVFPALTEVMPTDITLIELQMLPNKVTLTGNARSNVSLSLLINNLQFSGKFTDVVVEQIETAKNENAGLDFIIRASLRSQNK